MVSIQSKYKHSDIWKSIQSNIVLCMNDPETHGGSTWGRCRIHSGCIWDSFGFYFVTVGGPLAHRASHSSLQSVQTLFLAMKLLNVGFRFSKEETFCVVKQWMVIFRCNSRGSPLMVDGFSVASVVNSQHPQRELSLAFLRNSDGNWSLFFESDNLAPF